MKYRIIEETKEDNSIEYKIQKKVGWWWKTYDADTHDWYIGTNGMSSYKSKEDCEEVISVMESKRLHNTVKSTRIVKNYE